MGFLSDFLCCHRSRKINTACKACTVRANLENVHQRRRRYTIPKRPKENVFQLLKYLKFSSDGNSIFVPVEIHEPISFLQKLAEPFEYCELLDKAAESFDPGEQVKYIAAFSHAFALKMRERHTRPFDALLGETYELDRTLDMGFMFIAEQLSITPKLAAFHCAGIGWEVQATFEYNVHMQTKFITIQPNIRTTIILNDVDSEFSFPLNLTYKLHNILFGELFFDVFGTTEIIEKRSPERLVCRLEYRSKFGEKPNDSPDMLGTISKNNQTLMNIRGSWKHGIEVRGRNSASDSSAANWQTVLEYHPLSKESEETYYFTEFASQLNEMENCVAPTDSRLRSDIRDLENGKLKAGNMHKKRLSDRVTKPFEPLLGETFEYDGLGLYGWKCLSEQIENVPPTAVIHCEAKGWICQQEFSYQIEFHKTFILVVLKGYTKVKLLKQDCEFLWKGNNIKIYNSFIGELIPEVQGTTTIVGLRKAKGYVCSLHYTSKNELIKENRPDVEGVVTYKKQPIALINADWRDGIRSSVVKALKLAKTENVFIAADFELIFKKPPIPSGRKLFYNMSDFACSLNRKVNGTAPTDSRNRGDVIALDSGLFDECHAIKQSLEEKQFKRMSHNLKRPDSERYKPTWFVKNDAGEWVFNGEYWHCKRLQDWSLCPEIF